MANRSTGGNAFGSTDTAINGGGKVTAKATSGTLVAANEGRIALYVSNPSSKEVWLELGATAVKEEGIYVAKESVLPFPIVGYTGVVSLITEEGEGTVAFSEV